MTHCEMRNIKTFFFFFVTEILTENTTIIIYQLCNRYYDINAINRKIFNTYYI